MDTAARFLKRINNIYGGIVVLSLVQVSYIWGELPIGGDVMIPFSAEALEKYLYQWHAIQNGLYFSLNYLPLYVYYRIVELFGLTVYHTSFLLLFLINFSAGSGIYKLVLLFSGKEKKIFYVVPILFYLCSPALLNGWHYMYFYASAPWFFYFLFKCIRKNNIGIPDVVWVSIILFFSSLDLPNPKYLFHLFFAAGIILLTSLTLGTIRADFFRKNIGKFFLGILLSAYLFFPLAYFATHYSPETYGVHTQEGYKDTGRMMDFGSATIEKMFRLYHNGINLNAEEKDIYLSSKLGIFVSYVFVVLITLNLLLRKKTVGEIQYDIIFICVSLVFLLLAVGPNPPFGALYEYLVREYRLLAFLRTTAGAVFSLSVFYSVMLFFIVTSLIRYQKLVNGGIILAILLAGYPLIDGTFYRNNSSVNKYADETDHGLVIPQEYFLLKSLLDKKRLDAKVFIPNMHSSYITNSWGYFGPPLYYFIYTNNLISLEKIYTNIYHHNVGFILRDSSLVAKEGGVDFHNPEGSNLVSRENILSLYTVPAEHFLPHVYVPEKSVVSNQNMEIFFEDAFSRNNLPSEATVFMKKQSNSARILIDDVVETSHDRKIEFRKINATKYRVRIHGAEGRFPVVFSDSFDSGWKMYAVNSFPMKQELTDRMSGYRLLEDNEGEQATLQELESFVARGWVSDLGDGQEQKIQHKKWVDGRERWSHEEKYRVGFVSKEFKGSIQNDNLPKGYTWETWFKTPLENERYQVVANGFANSWIIDVEQICDTRVKVNQNFSCVKNRNGTYDFEVVIEFWPQRLYFISAFASVVGFFSCFFGMIFFRFKAAYDRKDRVC